MHHRVHSVKKKFYELHFCLSKIPVKKKNKLGQILWCGCMMLAAKIFHQKLGGYFLHALKLYNSMNTS